MLIKNKSQLNTNLHTFFSLFAHPTNFIILVARTHNPETTTKDNLSLKTTKNLHIYAIKHATPKLVSSLLCHLASLERTLVEIY